MKNKNWEKIKEELYCNMDSFLVETTDLKGVPIIRSVKQLNKDRHLFVSNILKIFQNQHQQFEDIVKKLNSEIYEDTGITNYCKEILKELNKLK